MIRARSRLRRLLVIVVPAFILIGAASAGAWYALFRGVARDTPPPDGWIPAAAILAGSGTDGLVDGRAVDAQFSDPFAVAIGPDGSTYVADGGDSNSIRRISIDGIVSTVAGGHEGFRDGIGAMARLNTPSGVAVDHYGTIYVADTGNHAIRRITPFGRVTTLAGNGRPGWRDGVGRNAQFDGPMGLALDSRGLLVADA